MKKKQIIAGMIMTAIFICIDQMTKYLAVISLKNQSPFVIWDGVFELLYLENRGAAFSMLWGQRGFFLILTPIVVLILSYLYVRLPEGKRFFAARCILVLLVAGAIGNLIDRILHQYVIDFFYFKLIDFAVFNVADIYITVGAALLIITFFFYYKEDEIDRMLPSFKKKDK